jgi:c-di-GMP-binding flagellar brake protein YcgR
MLRKEKRRFVRLKAYQLSKYRVIYPEERKSAILDSIKDIGGGGVCFRIEEDLPISSILELQINVPFLAHPLRCLVKVVWTRRLGKSNKYEIGTEFVEIDESARKKIMEKIGFVKEKTAKEIFFKKIFKKMIRKD